MMEDVYKISYIDDFKKITRDTHFYEHQWILHTYKYGYRHQNYDSSCARFQAKAQYVILPSLMAAILRIFANM